MKHACSLLLVPVAALTLAACGGGDKGPGHDMSGHDMAASSAPAGDHGAQDVMFAQMMIPHHRQAITMARQAATKASSPEVRRLAGQIERAQGPEIRQLTGWLRTWGAPTSPAGGMHMGDGMMSGQDMKKLDGLSGRSFDKAFLRMMIEHHQGAVTMAEAERAQGSFAAAKAMANNIVTSQSAEITTMRRLLARPV
ncbi:DUF305 domain-containing protein [Actinoallomurus acaciae]|uniref:DUF305 domain-containing protein n=1 Tax=Actinoallomurus acaciae TaxID=502577 RepID=A0ABV5YLT6_9ACTN